MQNRSLLRFLPLFVLVMASPAAVSAQETQDTMKLPSPLRVARAEVTSAYMALNSDAAMGMYADSAQVDFQGQVFTGKPAVSQWLSQALQGLAALRFGTSTFTVTDTMVTERANYRIVLPDGNEQAGTSEAVWRKQSDGKWKIVRLNVT